MCHVLGEERKTHAPWVGIVAWRGRPEKGVVELVNVFALGEELVGTISSRTEGGILVDVAAQTALVDPGSVALGVLGKVLVRGH